MVKQVTVPWYEIDKPRSGLATQDSHQVLVQREVIPIIFVPGVMGSRLRRSGTNGQGAANGMPNLRWDPTAGFLYEWYSGISPARRKALLIGQEFNPTFLEVDNTSPEGDGFNGLMAEYRVFLETLRTRNWGALGELFLFPVYGFGYNWTDSNRRSGARLAARIDEVLTEGRAQTGLCERVILITHSMGGLVARAASSLAGAQGKILGIIHGVQPAFGAAAAYRRMKAGFEASGFMGRVASRFLGSTGPHVTALLANSMGGLQLLPSKSYRTAKGDAAWLEIKGPKGAVRSLPRNGDPFNEIYRVKAVVSPGKGEGPSDNAYWGLVDPNLLTPERVDTPDVSSMDTEAAAHSDDSAWSSYLGYLAEAESFQQAVGSYMHPNTWRFHGTDLTTADGIQMVTESNWVRSDSYPENWVIGGGGFRGFFRDADGDDMQAVLQDPAGVGDGTVPVHSATLGDGSASPGPPANQAFSGLEHQPAYENAEVQRWVIAAITAACHKRFQEKRG
jgi:pimeloyl-ACP methyl ester carboxylesterase